MKHQAVLVKMGAAVLWLCGLAAVDAVNEEACQLWDQTHGCPDCFGYGDEEMHPIDPECQSCGGFGVVI